MALKIDLDNDALDDAIVSYLAEQGLVVANKTISVTLIAGRNGNGSRAQVTIEDSCAKTPKETLVDATIAAKLTDDRSHLAQHLNPSSNVDDSVMPDIAKATEDDIKLDLSKAIQEETVELPEGEEVIVPEVNSQAETAKSLFA